MHKIPDDATLRRMTDYVTASLYLTAGIHDHRIPPIVADQWSKQGFALLSTNDLASRFHTTRRTICHALARLVAAGVIKEIGRTADKRALYAPCLERGDEWRAAYEERVHGER